MTARSGGLAALAVGGVVVGMDVEPVLVAGLVVVGIVSVWASIAEPRP